MPHVTLVATAAAVLLSLQASTAANPSAPLYPSFNSAKPAAALPGTLYPSFVSPKKLAVLQHSYDTPTGTVTTFSVSGAARTVPMSISNNGAITGYYTDSTGISHGFVRATDGTITSFDAPGAAHKYNGTYPSVTNNEGVVGGSYFNGATSSGPGNDFGFIRAANGQITTVRVGAMGNVCRSVAAINDSGVFAGTYIEPATQTKHEPVGAFLSSNGHVTPISPNGAVCSPDFPGAVFLNAAGTLVLNSTANNLRTETLIRSPSGTLTRYWIGGNSLAVAINSSGEIAGNYREIDTKKYFGYLRSPTGVLTENITGPNGGAPYLIGMNDSGTLLGQVSQSDNVEQGYVRTSDGTFTLISVPPGGGNYAFAINASGTVVGDTGIPGGGNASIGYIWTPPAN